MSRRVDLVVVGAGVVGLATARALHARRPEASLLVLEAEGAVGRHQTGHNSGVVHAGLYYEPGSLKARLCRAGRAALLELCAARDVPHEVCGKLVVACDDVEHARLDALEARGRANGLVGLERLDARQLGEREPHVRGVAALFVPETGIVDFGAVARALADELRTAGVEVRTDAALLGLAGADGAAGTRPGPLRLATTAGEIEAGFVVACAGLQADRVARGLGADPGATIVPFRGEYKRLVPARRGLVRRHLIYPVPDPAYPFLGVHFTRTVGGEVEIGPDAVLALSRHGYRKGDVDREDVLEMLKSGGVRRMLLQRWRRGLSELLRARSRGLSLAAMRRLVPELRDGDVEPARCGVRAQAVRPDGTLIDDFHMVRGPRSLHVLNAPSPAATASLAIGGHVAEQALDDIPPN
ncbi:MAG: L-2-hydroxyglutarate oxidase [Planctomycetes bacterium]|nr:L-2-hydroxyglutarate oxidase [Planctomycetota bacterium]